MPMPNFLQFMSSQQKQQKQTWSYDEVAPSTPSGSVLMPLRKREYQMRHQQFRHRAPRKIGPTHRQQQHNQNSSHEHSASSSRSSRNSIDSGFESLGNVAQPFANETGSSMDWSSNFSHSRISSNSLSTPYSKTFMSISQSMGFGGSSTPPSSTSSSHSLRNPQLSAAQLSGTAGRRMSTPSISTTPKQPSNSHPLYSTTEGDSSALSSSSSSSILRPRSAYSSARVWMSSSSTMPSMAGSTDSNGYCNTQSNRPISPENSPSWEYKSDGMEEYVSSKIPYLLKEKEFWVEGYDKIFAATWLSSDEVLMGTKCNKIILLNTQTDRRVTIARLDECIRESSDAALSRIRNLESNVQVGDGLGVSLNKTAASNVPIRVTKDINSRNNNGSSSTINFAATLTERSLRFFNAGRRSSTPSFPSPVPSHNRPSANITPVSNAPTTTTGAAAHLMNNGFMNLSMSSSSTGIRDMAINPSRTLIAIGSGDPFQVTIYTFPDMTPMGMMYGHTDLVFSLEWISDTILVTGSRDGSMRVWSMDSPVLTTLDAVSRDIEVRLSTIIRKEERTKVRDLALNKGTEQLMTLSTDGYVKLWDRNSYNQLYKTKLTHPTSNTCLTSETVCLAASSQANLFAVGSQSHISVIDPRIGKVAFVADSCDDGCGVRSLDFKSHILTTGGGFGRIGFFDLRAQRYLDGLSEEEPNRYHEIGHGWLNRDTAYAESIVGMMIRNAVYVLEYDPTGTQLFTAGGPLQLGLSGAYVGLWS
ncbi:DDB1- and CUL4-associated factor 12 [Entomortierella beljakovae]|nr:DDB1- and CUL4-associated factor 12 [Entomortierella beljakovae]